MNRTLLSLHEALIGNIVPVFLQSKELGPSPAAIFAICKRFNIFFDYFHCFSKRDKQVNTGGIKLQQSPRLALVVFQV